MAGRGSRHLYTNPRQRRANLRSFKARYGARKGARVYGAVVGKVRREQVAAGHRGRLERVRRHEMCRDGSCTVVRAHYAHIRPFRTSGTRRVYVRPHGSRSRSGKRERVRGHYMLVREG